MREDWIECTFKELTLSLKRGPFGGDLKKSFFVESGFPVYEQQHAINDDYSNIRYFIDDERFEKLKACNVGPGDYIVSCSGTMGKISRIPNNVPKGVINQALLRIRLNDEIMLHNYFIQYFKSSLFQKKILKDSRGSGMQNMAGIKELKPIPISIPPLVEQKAIVKKIEELFSSLDSGIADLTKSQGQLKIYRQAVLKKAFEGELTNVKMEIKQLSDECEIIMGQSPPGTSYNKEGIGTPLINGPVEFGKGPLGKTIKSKWTTKPTRLCEKGDLILCVRGSTTGKTNIADFAACVGRGVAAIRYKSNQQYLNSYMLFKRYEIFAKGTGTTFPSVSSKEIREFNFPVCSTKEQHQIVSDIESRLSVCDKVEKDIIDSLEKAQALRQSILKKAFEGTLLSEEEIAKCKADAAYEPASVLLERIKKEKKQK